MDQHHLQNFTRALHIYGQEKKVCLEQNISIGSHCMEKGHFLFHFLTFLCVHQIPVTPTKAINDIFLSRCFEMHKVGNFSLKKFFDNC